MNNSSKTLIIACAKLDLVNQCVGEWRLDNNSTASVTLLSTKGYRIDGISEYLDVPCKMLSEDVKTDIANFDNVIVIQHSRNVIPYLNVYKFLQANQVQQFCVKTLGKALVKTKPELLLSNINDGSEQQDNVIWIDPQSVTHCAHLGTLHFGSVVDGDWDLQAQPFESRILFYHSLKSRVEQTTPWSETAYYQDILASLNKGEVRFNCHNEQQLQQRCEKLELLFNEIKQHGWKQPVGEDYVTINIGRDGQLLFADGRHRMSIAKLLKLPSIPVKIAVRHNKWQDFKNEITSYAKEQGGEIYAPLQHVDLSGLRYTHDAERFELIAKHITKPASTILDIGSHWGRACAVMEQQGHLCTAVEGNITSFYFLQRIKQIEHRQFKAVCENIFEYVNKPMQFDVVLALNIFHHFIKTQELHQQLITLLANLQIHEMFLQTHSPDEPQMANAFRNYAGEQFAQFVIDHSCLNQFEVIANLSNGRKLFRLYL
ncbi:ParB N-terminal domain-containing protein [Neptunicella marina]|uniref:ParB N-terminal domain-containing protein n=1 Tax=Neptunicella marina TaxID=2125989 RepID=A0A8J6LXU4_9ALTE|nr:ParB N-terminal domain-containing protein [Neptunicella marina]MBC3765020.1 ParB N-terminal domain-containing protein [Neptunicella marina]